MYGFISTECAMPIPYKTFLVSHHQNVQDLTHMNNSSLYHQNVQDLTHVKQV